MRIADNRVQDEAGGTGVPAVLRGVARQPLHLLPGLALVGTLQEFRRFGPGIDSAMRGMEGPDLRKRLVEGQRIRRPVHHGRKIRIICGPFVHLAGCQACQIPGVAAIAGVPHTGAVKITAATGPEITRHRIADDMVDAPAVAMGTGNTPVVFPAFTSKDEYAFCRSGKHHDGIGWHRVSPFR